MFIVNRTISDNQIFYKIFLTYLMKKQGPYALQSKEPASCFFFDSPAFAFEPGKRLKKNKPGGNPRVCVQTNYSAFSTTPCIDAAFFPWTK